jgi:hypothetical protein
MVHVEKRALGALKKNILFGLRRVIKILGRIKSKVEEPRAIFFKMAKDLLERKRPGMMDLHKKFVPFFEDISEPVLKVRKRL